MTYHFIQQYIITITKLYIYIKIRFVRFIHICS